MVQPNDVSSAIGSPGSSTFGDEFFLILTNFEVFHLVTKQCRMLDIISQTK